MKPALGILLNLGDSFGTYRLSGRDSHWFNNYLRYYPDYFKPVYVFSYAKESNPYANEIELLPNRFRFNRFVYALALPWIYRRQFKRCGVLRVKQTLGVWPALLAKWRWRIPVVTTYGYDYAHFAKKEGLWWLVPMIKLTEWLGLKFSDKIIVTNTAMLEKVKKICGVGKVVLLPNGVDTGLFKPGGKPLSGPVKILTVGRLVHQKNQLNLVRAVAKLKFKSELTLVGRGPLKQKIFDLARALKVNLKYIEAVTHSDLVKIYQAADIFCLASHHEGSPKALLEAMSCGLPCVAADKAYSRFIIDNNQNGLLAANTPSGLAGAIGKLAADRQLAGKLGRAARATVVNRFNNSQIIHKEIKLLIGLIK